MVATTPEGFYTIDGIMKRLKIRGRKTFYRILEKSKKMKFQIRMIPRNFNSSYYNLDDIAFVYLGNKAILLTEEEKLKFIEFYNFDVFAAIERSRNRDKVRKI